MDTHQRSVSEASVDQKEQDFFRQVTELERLIKKSRIKVEEQQDEKEWKEGVKKHFDLLEARLKLIADFFGGTVTRLSEIPSDLKVDREKSPYLNDDFINRYPKITSDFLPFLQMDVKGRTYLFFLPDTTIVNVYEGGNYKGGNHDLVFTEIFNHLKEDKWFGVNP